MSKFKTPLEIKDDSLVPTEEQKKVEAHEDKQYARIKLKELVDIGVDAARTLSAQVHTGSTDGELYHEHIDSLSKLIDTLGKTTEKLDKLHTSKPSGPDTAIQVNVDNGGNTEAEDPRATLVDVSQLLTRVHEEKEKKSNATIIDATVDKEEK